MLMHAYGSIERTTCVLVYMEYPCIFFTYQVLPISLAVRVDILVYMHDRSATTYATVGTAHERLQVHS